MEKYKVICLMGEAGSGKDTLLSYVLRAAKDYTHEIIHHTTRPMREGEQEGVNYYYCSKSEFAEKVSNGDILEYACFNDWFYGTSYDALSKDKVNIGVFNPKAIRNLLNKSNIELYVFWLQVDPKERMLRQLNREEHPNVSEIARRFSADEQDFKEIIFGTVKMFNETKMDLLKNTQYILDFIKELSKGGEKGD